MKLKQISAAVALAAAAGGAHALTPWINGAPDVTIYISGGAAQDPAFGQTIRQLAVAGSLDVFGDATTTSSTNFGARWTAYYFTGQQFSAGPPVVPGLSAPPAGLAGRKVLVVKRSLGAAGYGVLPIINPAGPIALQELDINKVTAPGTAANPPNSWPAIVETAGSPGTVPGAANNYRVVVDSSNGAALAPKKISNAGILGVDAKILLKQPQTWNYPVPVPTVGTGVAADAWPTTVDEGAITNGGFTQLGTGGLVYGIAVNTNFYNVLQAAQKRAGILPASTVIGSVAAYQDPKQVPTLSRNFVGSLIAGKIQTWDQVKIVDVIGGGVKSLTDPAILADAGISAGNGNLPATATAGSYIGQVPVSVGNRNAGAAIGAIAYSVFLNFPWTNGAFAPATGQTSGANELLGVAPIVKLPGGAAATGNLLDDWDKGTNVSTLNPNSARRWGIAINSADRNLSGAVGVLPETTAGGQNYRYVRIDGYLPTVQNVAGGNYPHWAEGELIYKAGLNAANPAGPNTVNDAPTQELLTKIAAGLGSSATAATTDQALTTTWGVTGIFGIVGDAQNPGNIQSIPYSDANPVVPYTHKSGGSALDQIVPTAVNPAGGLLLQ